MKADEYDVIIIGSGAGGGACLWALARRNVKVLMLEAGPEYDYRNDYRLHRDDWELGGFPEKMPVAGRQTYAELQPLEEQWHGLRSWGETRGRFHSKPTRQPFAYHHVVGLGGSTLHYTGEAHRINPAAMQMHSRFGVAADWPVAYDELEPYYQNVEELLGVAGPTQVNGRQRSRPHPLPAHQLNYSTHPIQRACERQGLTLEPNPVAILSRPYDERPGCNYCNNCQRGCPRADKGSVDVTFIRHAREHDNCTIRTGAEVIGIDTAGDDSVGAVRYVDADGNEHRVAARAVVVACGAVETPRLLLNSANPAALEGVANESGLVGRNFMETIFWRSSALHPEPLGSHRGIPADGICWDYNGPDAIDGVIGGCRFTTSVGESGLIGPVNYAKRIVGGWGRSHKQRMRQVFGRVLSLGAVGESLPNERSFIDLDLEERDKHDLPKARINSRLDAMELKRMAFMANKCRELLQAGGAENLVEEYGAYDYFSSTQVFGTCRMGIDPATSVVDPHGRSHRWKNLFIADASVFPSSGGGEAPSLTIEALAIRTADRIVELAASRDL